MAASRPEEGCAPPRVADWTDNKGAGAGVDDDDTGIGSLGGDCDSAGGLAGFTSGGEEDEGTLLLAERVRVPSLSAVGLPAFLVADDDCRGRVPPLLSSTTDASLPEAWRLRGGGGREDLRTVPAEGTLSGGVTAASEGCLSTGVAASLSTLRGGVDEATEGLRAEEVIPGEASPEREPWRLRGGEADFDGLLWRRRDDAETDEDEAFRAAVPEGVGSAREPCRLLVGEEASWHHEAAHEL
jgi:hypothetical protein